jgi:hypothetical protein
MISLKEIVWVKQAGISGDYIYHDGILNGHQVISIHESVDSLYEKNGYTVYDHIGKTAASDRTVYKTLDDAKTVSKKKVEDFVFGLIDMRDYKISTLLESSTKLI